MRKLAVFASSFAAGIFLAQYLLPVRLLLPCAVSAFLFSLSKLFLPPQWGRRIFLAALGLSLALGYDWLYIRQVQRPMEALSGTEQALAMTLCGYAEQTDYGAKATVRADGLPGKLVYYGGMELLELQPGQTVSDTVRLQSAARIRDDDVTSFTSKGVFLLAYSRGTAVSGVGTMTSPRWWPARLGKAMRTQIQKMFDGDTAAFLMAILTGDKSGLSTEAAANLSESGLYHILAVSGMHCGFLLAMIHALTGKHRRRFVAACAVPLLVFYALLTGGSPSVLRACVMLAFLLAAPLFHRDSDGPTALSAALLLILAANPFAAASISLQLSFAAMTGILFATPRLYSLLAGTKKHGKPFNFTVVGFSATMGALIFTVPLSGYYFGTLVLVSPLSNLLCLWAAGIVFSVGLAAVLLGLLYMPLGVLLGAVPAVLIRYMLAVAGALAGLPYHAVYFANPYLACWLVFAYILFTAAWLLHGNRRQYLLASVLAAAALAVTVRLGEARFHADLDAVVLDVGQGQCVLLASAGEFALVDCGSANSWYGAGELANQYLRSLGCKKLDYLLLTHYDSDHTSGVADLAARLDIETLLAPESGEEVLTHARQNGACVETVEEQFSFALGTAELTVFPPLGDQDDNERGITILVSAGESDLLITGDMGTVTEKKLLETYDLPGIEVLVAGHHGSKSSTSAELLAALAPETVCISVGSNSYGHPSKEAVRRIAEQGCAIYRTDMQGHIHLSLNEGGHHGIREEGTEEK